MGAVKESQEPQAQWWEKSWAKESPERPSAELGEKPEAMGKRWAVQLGPDSILSNCFESAL
jgi:hypothetical protein